MSLFESKKPALKIRGIHLDLKGLPPTPKRLLELLDLIAAAQINCVLVEWEDTYPWRRYPELRCETAYSQATVKKFLSRAKTLSIQIIPLIQCFGHMENVLSKKRFVHLRELSDNVADICPSKQEGRKVIIEMIEDILKTHEGMITHFHLGGDEAWTIGSCIRCKKVAAKKGKDYLYLQHVSPLLEALKAKGLRPILWDDMMRRWPLITLRELSSKADLMCWSYAANPFIELSRKVLSKFVKAGFTIWGASAFKGADGAGLDLPKLDNRISNMLAWVKEAQRRNLVGVIATGWSRYSTFMVPCEGLESSLDSLVLAGAVMKNGSLPKDFAASVNKFFNSGRLKKIAGESFPNCKKKTQDLANWRKSFPNYQQQILSLAHMVGEPKRCNPYDQQKVFTSLKEYLIRGEEYGREWMKAHSGLIADIWLERYVTSRILPVRQFVKMMMLRCR